MNTTPRKMPSELAIRAHWAKRLWAIKGFDSEAEFLERGTCFACGMDGSERAHIVARSVGGSDGCPVWFFDVQDILFNKIGLLLFALLF